MSESAFQSPPPVILQVLPALDTGGVERGTVDMAAAIQAAGGTALVVSSGGKMVRELERCGAQHITLPARSKSPLIIRRNIARLDQIIRERGVSLVHARSRAPAWSAYYAARRCGVPFVTTYHGTYNGGLMGLKDRYNAIMTRGQPIIAISAFIKQHIIATHGTDPENIRVVPRGIDVDIFNPAAVTQARVIQLTQQWQIADRLGVPVIMLPGRLTRWKGQEVLIEALARRDKRGDVLCLLVGSDQGRHGYSAELREQILRHGLGGMVHLVGDCTDMAAAYMLADIVVSASTDPEAFGRVAVEGQAMGRGVIATDNGAATETVRHGVTGLLVPPSDPVAMARAIDQLVALTPAQRQQMGTAGRQNVLDHFTRQRMCDSTLAIYRDVLARHQQQENAA